MQYLKIHEMPAVGTDVLITALAGWADAGEAATAALRFICRQLGARKFAELDPEEFYDFSQVRPYSSLTREGMRRIRWPANELLYSSGGSGQGIMMFLGVEPNLKWRTYADAIIDIARQCGVSRVIHIGALLDAVPHTRQVLLTGSANEPELSAKLQKLSIRSSRYQGPTGITSAVLEACTRHGLSYVSMWGHAPHYLHAAPNYSVSYALIKGLSRLLGIDMKLDDLEYAASVYRREVDAAAGQDSQLSAYVKRLEERYDDAEATGLAEMPRPEELVRELEDFLKEHRRHLGGGDPGL